MFRRTLLVGALLLTGLHSALADAGASPPQGVVAVFTAAGGWLSWAPPSEVGADFYRVYGVSGGTKYMLMETTNLYAGVPTSYTTYSVSSVDNGIESAAVEPCLAVKESPPPPTVIIGSCI